MATVDIKQMADASADFVGLTAYGRSKFPGCYEIVQPAKGPDGRWITGFDEESVSVTRLSNPDIKSQRYEELKEKRIGFQNALGIKDLSGTSEYWESYFIQVGKPLDTTVPAERMALEILKANHYAAPDAASQNDPEYRNTKFYISTKEEELSDRIIKRQDRDRATAELYGMRNKKNKLLLIGQYLLSAKVNKGMSPGAIYELLAQYLEQDNKPPARERTIAKFLDAVDKTVEELQFKLIVEEAVVKHIIRVREGYYQRGNVTYGRTLAETIKYLSNPENANELASVNEELEEKRKYG